ncbi:hypothetical protein B0H21DRAFT_709521 [Amylocystis lapponica]|nr:hypothetical protein B0H21DRAFT_709521 [Amylocystis lapponica]
MEKSRWKIFGPRIARMTAGLHRDRTPPDPNVFLRKEEALAQAFIEDQEEGYRMVMGETQSEADEEDEDAAPVVKVDKGKQRQANPALPAPQHDAEVVSSSPRPVRYVFADLDAIMGGPADPIDVDDILGGPADPIDVDDILGGPAHPINTDAVWRESAGDIDIDIDDDMGISDALADTLEPSEGMSARRMSMGSDLANMHLDDNDESQRDTQAADSPELDEDVQQVVGPSFPALQQMEAETIRLTATMTRLDEMSRVNRQNMAALDALLNMYTSK